MKEESMSADLTPTNYTPEEFEEVKEKFINDRLKFVKDYPFYGFLLLEVDPQVRGMELPAIAAINYKNIFLQGVKKASNEQSLAYGELSEITRKSLLAHEILHLVFEHLACPVHMNRKLANIAQDAVINRVIAEDPELDLSELYDTIGGVKPIKGSSGRFEGFVIGDETFNIPDFHNKDWPQVYEAILKKIEEQQGANNQEGINAAIDKLAEQIVNDLQGNEEGSIDPNSPEYEKEITRFRNKVIEATEIASKTQGKVPSGVKRLVDEFTDSSVPWWIYLRRLLRTETARNDFSNKLNPRRSHLGRKLDGKRQPPVFPKLESHEFGDVYLALDTSGSMSRSDIVQGLSEFKALRQTAPFRLHFMSCDAAAYEVKSYDINEEPDWSSMPIHGGGGTDFRPVFDIIELKRKETKKKPTLLVYFTDTMGTFPNTEPDYPVIWVCNYKGGHVPWGTYVEVT